ncbi:inner membrane transport permease yadH, partial [Yersinia pestis PY-34]
MTRLYWIALQRIW